ncbi:general substrate transporter [Pluteus cervinus]|uniref:General substrate transporter n=1 Tax=Pluteus cervinus TaxID=181527 RepID=A0ACD3ACT8_9AGAR|nr:general substrate transporter [Pluteus cervinus]
MSSLWQNLKPKTYTPRYPRRFVGRPLLFASSALASLGDAMFGYSQGIIAAAQVQPSFIRRMFGKDVSMDMIQRGDTGVNVFVQAITVACLNITALVAALVSAYLCDHFGRRISIRIGAVLYFAASLIQLFAPNLSALIVGRCLQGCGVGILSMTVPILQCEIAPAHGRGQFVAIEYMCLNAGYVLASWVGYGFFFAMPNEISWRGPYIIQAALAVILFVWSLYLPETPRWLIKNGFRAEGLGALADLNGTGDPSDPQIQVIYREICAAIEYEENIGDDATWGQVFTQYTRRTVVGVTCQMFAQLNGINAILYFLPSNLTRAGFTISRSLLYSGICALLYCSGTIPTFFGIDRYGRRAFLLVGSAGLTCTLAIVGGLQYKVDALPVGDARTGTANGIFAAVCVYLFIFGATWGPTPWLLGAEIYPLRARAKGMALSTCSNWIFNFIIAFITPPLFSAIHGGYYFLLLGFCVLSGVVVFFVYPETKGCSLEELGEVFGDKTMVTSQDGGSDITLQSTAFPNKGS